MTELNGALAKIEEALQSCKWVTIEGEDWRVFDCVKVAQALALITAIRDTPEHEIVKEAVRHAQNHGSNRPLALCAEKAIEFYKISRKV